MGRFDPPPIEEIATAMRDRQWLDMKVLDHGTLERVCPLNITIWPNRDEVLLRQEYHHREETTHHELTVNAEDIMWARPTILDVRDVEPPILRDPEEEPTPDYISRAIIDTISFTESIPAKVWFEGSRPHETHCRKLAIRLMWELTSLNQTSIPQFFGYTSGGMTNNALHYTAKNYAERVRQLWDLMQIRVGHTLRPVKRTDPRSRQVSLLSPA
jgi:hypothetical protein